MKIYINEFDFEISIEMLNQINDLRITEAKLEDVINAEKGSRVAGEVLYYLSLDWLNKNCKYEQDHLHPEIMFEYKPHSVFVEDCKKWRSMRNKLPNLHLLEGRSNGSKNDMRLIDYYNDMNKEQQTKFFVETRIPDNVSLEFEDFGEFYEARKKVFMEKIRELLINFVYNKAHLRLKHKPCGL